jgi:enediyne biosynthesis protein E4
MNFRNRSYIIYLLCLHAILSGCRSGDKNAAPPLFTVLDSERTGLDFSNDLSYSKDLNLFKYIYFYNGSGVGAGDFNNDGLIDLFFGSNQKQNKLFINTGNLHFKDITEDAGIPKHNIWTTGISVVDINADGLLDIYICCVGNYGVLKGNNQLLINTGIDKNGIPHFVNKAHEFGLDYSGFSTQAAFLDYDMDGDLDVFLLNHSVHENGTFKPRKDFIDTYHPLSGDRIYRNDDQEFHDVTQETGINSTAIGYGLGIAVADINLDGYPDLYIGNDFHEDDYLYINQHNGTFKEVGQDQLMHTSQFTMGVDVADVNNDAYPEIISMDMLPSDPYILKRSLGEDAYNTFNYKISVGYSYQYTRNNFQYNRRNGMFSEIGLFSGLFATDWSWSPLWMDFNNDGLKDLFISNGIPKRMNDIDYINFASSSEIQQKIHDNSMDEKDLALINKFPEIKLPNRFYSNKGNFSFESLENRIEGNKPGFSNGAAYADLDNDGDLDIVVNDIDGPVQLYENKNNQPGKRSSVELKLIGQKKNQNAVGAKVIVYAGKEIRTYEKFPIKGFLSSMESPLHIGLDNTSIDSMFLLWPDNSYQQIRLPDTGSTIRVTYQNGLPGFDYSRLTHFYPLPVAAAKNITAETGISWRHQENHFVEFDREPLIPHMLSTEGPALAIGDIDHNGLEDIFIGSSRDKRSAIYLQEKNGKFHPKKCPALENDSAYEDVAAVWADVNKDGNSDLVVGSGGNEFYGKDSHNSPRIYLNDGKANFMRSENAFPEMHVTPSCVTAEDFNGDGYMDLFIGGRAVPYEYGKIPQSYLLLNDKTGKFKDVTTVMARGLESAGLVTSACWVDMDKDGRKDLILSLEWGVITAWLNKGNSFTKKELGDKKGWWNFVLPCDIDNDNDIDLIAGNLGLNSRLKASPTEPVRLYYNDFDDNGKNEQVLTYFLNGREIPFANKAELEKQIPELKKKFIYAENFAKASLFDLFGKDKLKKEEALTADYFSSAVFINEGNLSFRIQALPMEAQLSSMRDAVIADLNNDKLPDILMMGNYYDNNIEMGRSDADFGTVLLNRGNGSFSGESLNGLAVKGQVRHIGEISIRNQKAYVLSRNNDSLAIIQFSPFK